MCQNPERVTTLAPHMGPKTLTPIKSGNAFRQLKLTTADDWRESKTAEQCLSHLCLSEHLSDITFTFKGHRNARLPAHKFVLSMRSSVFEAMFYGPLAEIENTVIIEDIKPEIMKVLLRYMYSDNPVLDEENVLPCVYAAKKYALAGLLTKCSELLENSIVTENVCALHEQAVFYDIKSLEKKCFNYILENAPDVLATKGFLKLSHATFCKLLQHDELAEDEVNVFKAAINWAKNECKSKNKPQNVENLRESLDKALFAIRFPIMPIADFAKVVTPAGILTSEEQIMMYQYNATGGATVLNKFLTNERLRKTITIDVSTQGAFFNCGYLLRIAETDAKNLPFTKHLRIQSITGTFVKDVKSIRYGSVYVNFNIEGNKIFFKDPPEIVSDQVLCFDTEIVDQKTLFFGSRSSFTRASSKTTNIKKQVFKTSIVISQVPEGMETITLLMRKN